MKIEEVAIPTVRSYCPEDRRRWEDLVARACNGTFLHTRRFIAYHGDRFRDRSLVLENRRKRIVGVFPAAEAPSDPDMVISHPGLSYGGVVHDGTVRGAAMVGALDAIANHYRSLGYRSLRYKAVPSIFHASPAEDDLYALFRLGARRHQCDLSVAVDLANRGLVTRRRRHSQKRAGREGVQVQEDWDEIVGFWRLLERNLAIRHGASPVHSVAEIQFLHENFPDAILLIIAKIGADLAGGALLFLSDRVSRAQYTATTRQGRIACATDPVMEHALDIATKRGCRYFDFGTCTLDEGRSLNQGLYHFKVSFGGGGVLYHHYELDLRLMRSFRFHRVSYGALAERSYMVRPAGSLPRTWYQSWLRPARDINEPPESEMRRTDGLGILAARRMLSSWCGGAVGGRADMTAGGARVVDGPWGDTCMMADTRPGLDSRRLIRMMSEAINRCHLDLSGLTVLTEAATGAYVVTPVIAAMAGADVYALAAGTAYASSEEIEKLTADVAQLAAVTDRIKLVYRKDNSVVGSADIVTNSGQVRPIDAEMVAGMKRSSVVPLMYESWEYRHTDVDLMACRARNIGVAGTNERHPDVDVFSFLGQMAIMQLHDAGIAVRKSHVLLLCDNDFGPFIVRDLKNAGAHVMETCELSADVISPHCDAVILALQPQEAPVFNVDDAKLLSEAAPGAVLVQYWGDADRAALAAAGVPVWPAEAPRAGHMGILPSAVGPEPIIRLQVGGLKVGQVLAQGLDRASQHDLAYIQTL